MTVPQRIGVRPLQSADIPACERILRSVPDWFGIEESNRQYIRDLAVMPGYVALSGAEVRGFLALREHNAVSCELHVLAVERDQHRRGYGRALAQRAEADLRLRGFRLLEVKTLGPSHPDEGYARTRPFYAALGFLPLEETTAFWGAEQPTLIMVKPLLPELSA